MGLTIQQIISGVTGPRVIGAPGRLWLDGPGLQLLANSVAGTLAGLGIGAGDRVAIVLPNGPEMATAFLSVAAVSCAAPLNPAYKADEFTFYLSDLRPAAIIIAA